MKLLRLVACIVAFLSSPYVAQANQWTVDTAASSVVWTAVGNPGFLEIKGEGAKLSGEVVLAPDASFLGVFTVALTEVKTGIALRDEHMHGKYLETAKFPTASLKLKEGFKGSGKWCGDLTVKGVTKPVCGDGKVETLGAGKKADLKFTMKVADYPIGIPTYLGVTMAETVDVAVAVVVKPKA
jgi:polyisoprenoid-binding protein YceI